MQKTAFTKMQGAGNDFIVIDNRGGIIPDNVKVKFVKNVCPRAIAVGADGVIFIQDCSDHDFEWDFYNADGSSAEMCGNGARCAARYAFNHGIAPENMKFKTLAGTIHATIVHDQVKIRLTDAALPKTIKALDVKGKSTDLFFINTGVPHAVMPVPDLEAVEIKSTGAAIRYHEFFAPAGTNVNFMAKDGDNRVALRTYERGVEDETLACGTGSVACAIVAADAYGMHSPIEVRTRSGGILTISFTKTNDGIKEVDLLGPATIVYTAELNCCCI